MEKIYEQSFILKQEGNWSFTEAYNLPIGLRDWFVQRLIQQLEKEKEIVEKASKGGSRSQVLNKHNQPPVPSNLKTG